MNFTARFVMPVLATIFAELLPPPGGPKEKKPAKRPCLQCRKLHSHNNAFCSARCCNLHKAACRQARKEKSRLHRDC